MPTEKELGMEVGTAEARKRAKSKRKELYGEAPSETKGNHIDNGIANGEAYASPAPVSRVAPQGGYNPYGTATNKRILFGGAEYQRRLPSGPSETKAAFHLFWQCFGKVAQESQEEIRAIAMEVLGRSVSDIEDLPEDEKEKVIQAILERASDIDSKASEVLFRTSAWEDLCRFICNTFYTPAIDYDALSPAVYDGEGKLLGRPFLEVHAEISDYLRWSEVVTFFRGIRFSAA